MILSGDQDWEIMGKARRIRMKNTAVMRISRDLTDDRRLHDPTYTLSLDWNTAAEALRYNFNDSADTSCQFDIVIVSKLDLSWDRICSLSHFFCIIT